MLMMPMLMTMTYIMTMFTINDDQDDDCYHMTINLNHGYGNNFELDHLQDVDMSKGVDNYDKIEDNGDGHIDLEGPLGSYKDYIR